MASRSGARCRIAQAQGSALIVQRACLVRSHGADNVDWAPYHVEDVSEGRLWWAQPCTRVRGGVQFCWIVDLLRIHHVRPRNGTVGADTFVTQAYAIHAEKGNNAMRAAARTATYEYGFGGLVSRAA